MTLSTTPSTTLASQPTAPVFPELLQDEVFRRKRQPSYAMNARSCTGGR